MPPVSGRELGLGGGSATLPSELLRVSRLGATARFRGLTRRGCISVEHGGERVGPTGKGNAPAHPSGVPKTKSHPTGGGSAKRIDCGYRDSRPSQPSLDA